MYLKINSYIVGVTWNIFRKFFTYSFSFESIYVFLCNFSFESIAYIIRFYCKLAIVIYFVFCNPLSLYYYITVQYIHRRVDLEVFSVTAVSHISLDVEVFILGAVTRFIWCIPGVTSTSSGGWSPFWDPGVIPTSSGGGSPFWDPGVIPTSSGRCNPFWEVITGF